MIRGYSNLAADSYQAALINDYGAEDDPFWQEPEQDAPEKNVNEDFDDWENNET